MKAALAINHGRMAPCFAGVALWIVGDDAPLPVEGRLDPGSAEVLSTHGWHPLGWGRELMRHDVAVLLCAGIDHGTWASVQGHGIQVIPDVMGDAASILTAWRQGKVTPPGLWPANPKGCAGRRVRGQGQGRGRQRFRGGRAS